MKNTQNKLFFWAIIIYALILEAFMGKIIFQVGRTPTMATSSTVPVLQVEKLNKLVSVLEKRINPGQPGKVDLSRFNFGKSEPFNP